jgi:magnesium transporter
VIVVHFVANSDGGALKRVARKILETAEPISPGAIWIDMIEPTIEEDKKVQTFVGALLPTKADPDYSEPPEAQYAENGVRYLHASVLSEPEDTPDITGVTFVVTPTLLVTVRYDPVESFEMFAQKLCKAPVQALTPDAVAVGLINTVLNRSARALSGVGEELEQIASAVFKAKGDQRKRNDIYSNTLNALGREDEKISNLRESLVSVERLLLFLSAEGHTEKLVKPVREAMKTALRDLQSLEEDASFKAQKVQFLLDATLGLINLAQNDIIKLFSVLAVIFMPPTVIASIYGMNFKTIPELEWRLGYPLALSHGVRGGAALSLLPLEEMAVAAGHFATQGGIRWSIGSI